MPINGMGISLKLIHDRPGQTGHMARLWLDGVDVSAHVLSVDVHIDAEGPVTADVKFWVDELDLSAMANVHVDIEPAVLHTPTDELNGGITVVAAQA